MAAVNRNLDITVLLLFLIWLAAMSAIAAAIPN